MLKIRRSKHSVKKSFINDKIFLIYQFFKHNNKSRHKEIQETLIKNCENDNIDHIILLNERIYSNEELGVSSDKVQQVNIGRRLNFSDIFKYIADFKIKGYIVVCNADIFFDKSLRNIKFTGIYEEKKMYAQLRFEYTDKRLAKCKIFGPRSDSQDAWIFHSNYNIPENFRKQFKVPFGIANCDLKISFLFSILDFEIINDPFFIKCYHNHKSNIRDYFNKPEIPRPLMFNIPFINPKHDLQTHPMQLWCKKSGLSYYDYLNDEKNFIDEVDMNNICSVLNYSFTNKINFSISFSTIENYNLYYLFDEYIKSEKNEDKHHGNQIISLMNSSLSSLKDQGLEMNNMKKLSLYVNELRENIAYSHINVHIPPGHSDYLELLKKDNKYGIHSGPVIFRKLLEFGRKCKKFPVGQNIFNIGAHMFKQGWFDLIENKKILIISKYFVQLNKQINNQYDNKVNYYKRQIFKQCKFDCIDIPHREDSNEEFIDVTNKYVARLKDIIENNHYDIVLVGKTPYDFFIANFIRKSNISVMNCGQFLPLWFGLYSKEDLRINRDIIKMFMNEHWGRLNEI